MENWSSEHRAFAVKVHYKNNDSFVGAQYAFRRQFSLSFLDPVPSRWYRRLVGKKL